MAADVGLALRSGAFGDTFDKLVVPWPGMVPLRLAIGRNVTQQHRILQMLQTIFEALALMRRSGIVFRSVAIAPSRA